jgi:hypothetical protein
MLRIETSRFAEDGQSCPSLARRRRPILIPRSARRLEAGDPMRDREERRLPGGWLGGILPPRI